MKRHENSEAVAWRDLVALTPCEKVWELMLSLPWLVGSFWFYRIDWWWLGLLCSIYFFLTGLRQSHNAQHYSLGLPRWAQDVVLFILSGTMLASMHAVQVTHLHHHRHCLTDGDAEGGVARLNWWRVLVIGPLFTLRLHGMAWRLARNQKRGWIASELLLIVWVILWGIGLSTSQAFRWHVTAMLTGECFTAFFAVWIVHHDCLDAVYPSRTQRGCWLNGLVYGMFYHTEHHMFPAVPTAHLPELAKRLDAVAPEFGRRQVLG